MEEAWPLLDQAVRDAPEESEPYLYRALVLVERGEMERAVADFEAAIARKPGWHDAHYHYGDALLELGRLDEAERELERATRGKSVTAAWAQLRLGDLRKERGDSEGAIAAYRASAERDPKGSGYHSIGDVHLERGERGPAMRAYEQDLDRHPECYEARINLAALYLEDGRPDGAARHYAASLRYHPDDPRALRGLGRARLAQGEPRAAADAFARALHRDPDDPETAALLESAQRYRRASWVWPLGAGLGLGVTLGWFGTHLVARRRRART